MDVSSTLLVGFVALQVSGLTLVLLAVPYRRDRGKHCH